MSGNKSKGGSICSKGTATTASLTASKGTATTASLTASKGTITTKASLATRLSQRSRVSPSKASQFPNSLSSVSSRSSIPSQSTSFKNNKNEDDNEDEKLINNKDDGAAVGKSEGPCHLQDDEDEKLIYGFYECNYDENVTLLYQALEEKAWDSAYRFLDSGVWDDEGHPDEESPKVQSRTWVTRYQIGKDGKREVRWSHLPIHAAIIFDAPSVIIKKLLEYHPRSTTLIDDQYMLPLHLAYQYQRKQSIIDMILDIYPEAAGCYGGKNQDHLPADYAPIPEETIDRPFPEFLVNCLVCGV